MNASQFIEDKLHELKEIPDPSPTDDLVTDLNKIIMSKKFRKYSVTPEYQEHIKNVITKSVAKKQPIPFVWVFGGYKLWSLAETPEVDWAELFSLVYFIEWLKSITIIYKPGVWFDFFSDDVVVPMMNNIDPKDIVSYATSFKSLLEYVQPYLPDGIKFTFNRVIDQYDSPSDFEKELQQNIEKLTKERQATPKPLTPAQIAMIDLNVKPDEKQLVDPYWRDKVQIIHDAYSMSSKRRPYYRNPDKIMVLNTPIPGALAVGTTKTSVVKFWVGVGALKKAEDSYQEYILSPKQISKTRFEEEPVSIAGLGGKNFQKIRVFV